MLPYDDLINLLRDAGAALDDELGLDNPLSNNRISPVVRAFDAQRGATVELITIIADAVEAKGYRALLAINNRTHDLSLSIARPDTNHIWNVTFTPDE